MRIGRFTLTSCCWNRSRTGGCLSVAGVATSDLIASLSLAAGSKATTTVDVARSVATSASTGTMNVHLQPGAFSFDTHLNGEVTLSSAGLDTGGKTGCSRTADKARADRRTDQCQHGQRQADRSLPTKWGRLPAAYHLTAAPAAATDTAAGTVYDTGGVQLVDGKNPAVYGTNAYYNSESCTLIDVQQMGRWKIAEVPVQPV